MNKRILVILSLVIISVFTLSSCELIVKDPEVDKKTVIVQLGNESITKEEVQQSMQQLQVLYQMRYGQSIDTSSDKFKENLKQSAIDTLIAQKVIETKIKELGFDTLSNDEIEEIKKVSEKDYQSSLDRIKTSYFADTKLDGEELNKALIEKANELGYNSVEDIIEMHSKEKKFEKIKADILKDVTVDDEEVKKEFDKNVDQDRVNIENNPSLYSQNVLNGKQVYFVPSGYRNVKQILIKFSDDDSKLINSLRGKISDKEQQIQAVNKSIEDEQKELDKDKENKDLDTSRIDTLKNSLSTYETELKQINAELTSAENKAFENINDKLNKVKVALSDKSKTFDSLIDEFNEDPGMKNEQFKKTGYPVSLSSNNYDNKFVEAAMSLKNIGDISEPTKGLYGYYIIKYESDIKEGPVEFDSVKDQIYNSLLENKKNEVYNEQVKKWVDESNPKIYLDRL